MKGLVKNLTFGPAGPPRQRGVRIVPQSTQVLLVSPELLPPPLPLLLQFSLSTSDNSPAESSFVFVSSDPSDIFFFLRDRSRASFDDKEEGEREPPVAEGTLATAGKKVAVMVIDAIA
jgi:hypothetical protein